MNAPAAQSRLKRLVEALNDLRGANALSDLERSYDALKFVGEFLEMEIGDKFGVDALDALEALSPLNELINALSDTLNGGGPELLRPTNQKKGAPGNQVKHVAQGAMAAAMDCLIFAGVQMDEAAKFVADEAHRQAICDQRGQRVTANQVASWGRRVGIDLSAGATGVHGQTIQGHRNHIAAAPEAEKQAVAKDLVKGILGAVRSQRVSPARGSFPT